MTSSTQPIVVVGAGVLGLSAASVLQMRHPSWQITIVSAELPTLPSTWTSSARPSADYASMWAGAHYRPIPRSSRQLNDEANLAFRTAELMFRIARDSPSAGVKVVPAVEYLESALHGYSEMKSGDLYAGPEDSFRVLQQHELPAGVNWGCEYQAYCVNVHRYCCWLLDGFVRRGGTVMHKRLCSVDDAFSLDDARTVPIVVNCSGHNFNQDPKMKIIRGQTVLVKNQYYRTITRQNADGGWTFLIPRPQGGGTVVGGTKEIGDTEEQARVETRQKLLMAAVKAFPDFVDDPDKFDVVMDNVGRRPWREGGLRLEFEELPQGRKIVHGYGAGGRGYELSWGAAERMADLVDKAQIQMHSRL